MITPRIYSLASIGVKRAKSRKTTAKADRLMAPRTIPIDGAQLKALREQNGFSRQGLAHVLGFSEDTLSRAEKGIIERAKLKTIVQYFGLKEAYFQPVRSESVTLSGKWMTFYLEQEPGYSRHIQKDWLNIDQGLNSISGVFSPAGGEHPGNYIGTSDFRMTGKIIFDMVYGSYEPEPDNPKYPQGSGVFQMKVLRKANWLEGFCTYYSDEQNISVSSTIWIRTSWDEYDFMLESAEKHLKERGVLFTSPIPIARD